MDKIPYVMISNRLIYLILSALLLYYLLPYLTPFLIALAIAVLLEPVVQVTARGLRVKRLHAVVLVFFLFLILILGLVILGAVKIGLETVSLIQTLPKNLNEIQQQALSLIDQVKLVYRGLPPETLDSVNSMISSAVKWANEMMKELVGLLIGFASGLPKGLILLVVTLLTIFLISLHLPKLKSQFLSLFSAGARKKITIILSDLNSALIGFVRAQIILSFCTYVITLLGLLILHIPFALSIAFIIVIVDLLPILGTGAVIVPWAVFLLYHGDAYRALGLGVLYVIIIIFRRIAEPKILGESIGISALATIMSMYLGFELFGPWGLFTGPTAVILFQAVRKAGLLNKKIDF